MKTFHVLLPAVLAASFFTTTRAGAFCRTTTDRPSPEAEGCAAGTPLFHPKAGLTYRIVENDILPTAVLREKLEGAIRAWTAPNVKCTPGITIDIGEPVPKGTPVTSYKIGDRNQNFLGVASSWNARPAEVLSLPTLTFNATSGAIFDADSEINGTMKWSFTDVAPPDGYDLQSVLTHEVGHLLGFAHSDDPESVMFPTYTPGEIRQRTLGSDDIEAVCAVYPNRDQRLSGRGLLATSTCESPAGDPAKGCALATPASTSDDGGCSSSGRHGSGAGAALVAFAAVAARMRRRRSPAGAGRSRR